MYTLMNGTVRSSVMRLAEMSFPDSRVVMVCPFKPGYADVEQTPTLRRFQLVKNLSMRWRFDTSEMVHSCAGWAKLSAMNIYECRK